MEVPLLYMVATAVAMSASAGAVACRVSGGGPSNLVAAAVTFRCCSLHIEHGVEQPACHAVKAGQLQPRVDVLRVCRLSVHSVNARCVSEIDRHMWREVR